MKPLRAARPATAARTATLRFEADVGARAHNSGADEISTTGNVTVEADTKDVVDAALDLLRAARDGADDRALQAAARELRFALTAPRKP